MTLIFPVDLDTRRKVGLLEFRNSCVSNLSVPRAMRRRLCGGVQRDCRTNRLQVNAERTLQLPFVRNSPRAPEPKRSATSHAMTDAPPVFVYRTVGADGIDAVRPLWEKLRAYHAPLLDERPPYLFAPRKQGILSKAAAGKLRIELVSIASHAADMAYCISTVSAEGGGEVDSIFVEEHYRGCGVGSELLRRALAWLDSAGASSKVVTVAHGNEGALALYRRLGFHPRTILLQQRHNNAA